MSDLVRPKGATATKWQAINPILARRELVLEIDTGKLKTGDGVSHYIDLPYISKGDKGDKGDKGEFVGINEMIGVSSTDLSLTPGTKVITTQINKAWSAGLFLQVTAVTSPTDYFIGQVTSYNSALGELTLVVSSEGITGSGSFSSWNIVFTSSSGIVYPHATKHVTGSDAIPIATATNIGLMSAEQAVKLDSLNFEGFYVGAEAPPPNFPINGIWVDIADVYNTAPTIVPIFNQSILTGDTLSVPVIITDAEDVNGCVISGVSSNSAVINTLDLVFSGSGGTRAVDFGQLDSVGSSVITITVTDSGGLTASTSFELGVGGALYVITSTRGTHGNVSQLGDVYKVAGSSLTLIYTSDPGYYLQRLVIDAGTQDELEVSGVNSYTFNNISSSHTIDAEFSLNQQPTITTIADITLNYQTASEGIAITVGDLESVASSLTLTGSSTNKALIPDANLIFTGTTVNRTLMITPANGQPTGATAGSSIITVTVSDGNLYAQSSFLVVVNPAIPSAVASLTSAIGDSSINLNWTANARATTYTLYWTSDGSIPAKDNGTAITGLTGTSYLHTGCTNGLTYKYCITAVNMSGEGIESNVTSSTPIAIYASFETGFAPFTASAQDVIRDNTYKYSGSYSAKMSGRTGAWGGRIYRQRTFGSSGTHTFDRWFSLSSFDMDVDAEVVIIGVADAPLVSGWYGWRVSLVRYSANGSSIEFGFIRSGFPGLTGLMAVPGQILVNTWYRVVMTADITNKSCTVTLYDTSGAVVGTPRTSPYTDFGSGQVYDLMGVYESPNVTLSVDNIMDTP